MGEAGTTATSAWVSQARLAHENRTTSTPHLTSRDMTMTTLSGGEYSHPLSSSTLRPTSGRPLSSVTTERSSTIRPDSGFWSAAKGLKVILRI